MTRMRTGPGGGRIIVMAVGVAFASALVPSLPTRAQTVVGPTTLTLEDALGGHGIWVVEPGIGPVWFPRVGQGWAPHRTGQWSWMDPGGWMWVEAAPWGGWLAPGGQWTERGGRWAWVPPAPPRTIAFPGPARTPAPTMGQPPAAPLPTVSRPDPPIGARPPVQAVPLPGGVPPAAMRPPPPPAVPPVVTHHAPNWGGPLIHRPDPPSAPARMTPTRPATPPPDPAAPPVVGGVSPHVMPWGGVIVPTPPPVYRSVTPR